MDHILIVNERVVATQNTLALLDLNREPRSVSHSKEAAAEKSFERKIPTLSFKLDQIHSHLEHSGGK